MRDRLTTALNAVRANNTMTTANRNLHLPILRGRLTALGLIEHDRPGWVKGDLYNAHNALKDAIDLVATNRASHNVTY
jgi:hypothetical protein